MHFIEELRWRGMIHDSTPEVEEYLSNNRAVGYAGFDPTAPSLHIGNLIPVMMLVHFQRSGNTPVILVGGATAMIGDPSGKTEERKLLSIETVRHNQERIARQLRKFFDAGSANPPIIVNNYDWLSRICVLDFLRDVGKHLTVNYMAAKESVKNRWEGGISFTEFSYQLLQAYDFYRLHCDMGCNLQMGGSDQWGNITSGVELVRRMTGDTVHGITCPLLTKADGTKFGKSAGGENLWLDADLTSPYKFYQYWLNTADEDAGRLLRIFSLLPRETIENMEKEHAKSPHLRILQKTLAEEVTARVHSPDDLARAIEASEILFGKGTAETLVQMSERDFLSVFEGVPQAEISLAEIESGVPLLDLISVKSGMFASKGEARRMIAQGGLFLNKEKCGDPMETIGPRRLLQNRYLLFQKGRKNFFIIKAV